jgi:hypothetical protein
MVPVEGIGHVLRIAYIPGEGIGCVFTGTLAKMAGNRWLATPCVGEFATDPERKKAFEDKDEAMDWLFEDMMQHHEIMTHAPGTDYDVN